MSTDLESLTNPFLDRVMHTLRQRRPALSRRQPFLFRREMFPHGLMAQIWFITHGCSWDACTMCDYGKGPRVSVAEMVTAVRAGLEAVSDDQLAYLEVSLSGSMLDPVEVPPAARQRIFALMNEHPVPHVMFETRAETVDGSLVGEVRAAFPDKKVSVMVGLESADPWIQRHCVNKRSHPDLFEQAAGVFHTQNIEVIANVSLGSAFLSPVEAIDDAVASTRWSLEHGADIAVLYPLQTKEFTLLAQLFEMDEYRSPSLWSLVEALRRLEDVIGRVTIAWYLNYYDQPFLDSVDTCPRCRDRVFAGLDAFHASQSFDEVVKLDGIECACREAWRARLEPPSTSLSERVAASYERLAMALGLEWDEASLG